MTKMILFDPVKAEIVKDEIEVDTSRRIENIYYKTSNKEYINIAYLVPPSRRKELEELIKQLKEAEKTYRDIQANIFYKELPKLREE